MSGANWAYFDIFRVLLFSWSNYHNIFEVFITEDSKSSSLWVSIEKRKKKARPREGVRQFA